MTGADIALRDGSSIRCPAEALSSIHRECGRSVWNLRIFPGLFPISRRWRRLEKEAKYEGLNSKQIEKEKIENMFAEFGGIKNARNFVKSKRK